MVNKSKILYYSIFLSTLSASFGTCVCMEAGPGCRETQMDTSEKNDLMEIDTDPFNNDFGMETDADYDQMDIKHNIYGDDFCSQLLPIKIQIAIKNNQLEEFKKLFDEQGYNFLTIVEKKHFSEPWTSFKILFFLCPEVVALTYLLTKEMCRKKMSKYILSQVEINDHWHNHLTKMENKR